MPDIESPFAAGLRHHRRISAPRWRRQHWIRVQEASDFNGFGEGQGAIVIANAAVAPTANVKGAGILYVQDGALEYRGSNGTVTVIASAWAQAKSRSTQP
jgi:hypothetical protein